MISLTGTLGKSPIIVFTISWANTGYVNVGIDNDIAQFAVHSIRRWLNVMTRDRYPDINKLMITADGCGSNGSHARLSKIELKNLADETPLALQVFCTRDYRKGIKVSDAEMMTLNIEGDTFHPEWVYTISPRAPI